MELRFYENNGGFLVEGLEVVFPPPGLKQATFVISRPNGEVVTTVPLRLETPLASYTAFGMFLPNAVSGLAPIGEAGDYVLSVGRLESVKRADLIITAMAKGVRPTKLLLKYPVRIALNPFISGIGHLFPQLVSGGAIVSIVLSLPTVGPLLLRALQTEDMYLAGSMLMVLSLLAVVGTLVSDLLLLWLDPRIRFEGGTR